MLEVTLESLSFLFAGVYITALVLAIAHIQREKKRRTVSLTEKLGVAVLCISIAELLLPIYGIGTISTESSQINYITTVSDTAAYVFLYGSVAILATDKLKYILATAGSAVAMRVAFTIGSSATSPTVSLIAATLIGGGYLFVIYLLYKTLESEVDSRSREIIFLYRKLRNILVISFGGLIVFAVLFLTGVVQTPFLSQSMIEYNNIAFKIGSLLYIYITANALADSEVETDSPLLSRVLITESQN